MLLGRGDADFTAEVEHKLNPVGSIIRLLQGVDGVCDMVGFAIAEFLPWDMLRLQQALASLPIMQR